MATVAPFVFGALGAVALLRGIWRPHRAVLKRGMVTRCSGANPFGTCDATIGLAAAKGTPAYAVVSGRVGAVGDNFVHIVARNEPVVLVYDGITPAVTEGQYVGKGQEIGQAVRAVSFGVWALRHATGGVTAVALPPSAWMSARGIRPFSEDVGDGNTWCEGGRTINVPADAVSVCSLQKPDASRFAAFPVEINLGS